MVAFAAYFYSFLVTQVYGREVVNEGWVTMIQAHLSVWGVLGFLGTLFLRKIYIECLNLPGLRGCLVCKTTEGRIPFFLFLLSLFCFSLFNLWTTRIQIRRHTGCLVLLTNIAVGIIAILTF